MGGEAEIRPGTLVLMILKTLETLGPIHGYGIARRIEQVGRQQGGPRLLVNYGTLYPALIKLEQEGCIAAQWGESENHRRAKFYRLTPAGRKLLAREASTWQRDAELLARFLAAPGAEGTQ
ncbi:MAG: PadR family transcriptional regulator [Terriglobales bacterium]